MSRPDVWQHRFECGGSLAATVRLAAAIGVAVALAAPASAGKVYRCGNSFQDQPCAEAKGADARPAARADATREAPNCSGPARKDAADCVAKSPRDAQRTAATAVK